MGRLGKKPPYVCGHYLLLLIFVPQCAKLRTEKAELTRIPSEFLKIQKALEKG